MHSLRTLPPKGGWLVLKNCHLVTPWLPELERELHALGGGNSSAAAGRGPAPGFRLFLTSEAHPGFPATLLEACTKVGQWKGGEGAWDTASFPPLHASAKQSAFPPPHLTTPSSNRSRCARPTKKVTFEAPPGLKQNLTRTLASWSPEALAAGGPLRAQLSFLLAWLHAVLQERRSYVPHGWSKAYEISAADLRTGLDLVAAAAEAAGGGRSGGVPWRRLAGLLAQAVYGGRVDDAYDAWVSGQPGPQPSAGGPQAAVLVPCITALGSSGASASLLSQGPAAALTSPPPCPALHPPQPTPQMLQAHVEAIISPDLIPDAPSGRARRRLPSLPCALPAGSAALDRGQWAALVAALPERDNPAVFGLPANIERAAAAAAATATLGALRRIGLELEGAAASGGGQASGSGSGGAGATGRGFNRAAWTARLGPLLERWQGLVSVAPPGVQAAAAAARAPAGAAAGGRAAGAAAAAALAATPAAAEGQWPIAAFVSLETGLAATVVGAIGRSLGALRRALEGTEAPPPEVQVRGGGTDTRQG
jgi:hypothetical protein